MYDYTIYPDAVEELFYAQCNRIEQMVAGIRKVRLLEDVDGSLIQIYAHAKGKVKVYNDEMVGALYVKSDFDLRPYGAILEVKK